MSQLASLLTSCLSKLIRDERGQAITEYILLLSATLVGVVTLTKSLIGVLDRGVLKLGGQLEKDLKTGRAPLSVWKN